MISEALATCAPPPTRAFGVTALANALHAYIAAMNLDNFIVRPQRQYVAPFQDHQRWETLSRTGAAQLARYGSGLPTQLQAGDETAKHFDLLVLQLAHVDKPRQQQMYTVLADAGGTIKEARSASSWVRSIRSPSRARYV